MVLKLIEDDKGPLDNAVEDCDNVLELAKGHYQDVVIIGYDKNGEEEYRSSKGMTRKSEISWIIKKCQKHLLP